MQQVVWKESLKGSDRQGGSMGQKRRGLVREQEELEMEGSQPLPTLPTSLSSLHEFHVSSYLWATQVL